MVYFGYLSKLHPYSSLRVTDTFVCPVSRLRSPQQPMCLCRACSFHSLDLPSHAYIYILRYGCHGTLPFGAWSNLGQLAWGQRQAFSIRRCLVMAQGANLLAILEEYPRHRQQGYRDKAQEAGCPIDPQAGVHCARRQMSAMLLSRSSQTPTHSRSSLTLNGKQRECATQPIPREAVGASCAGNDRSRIGIDGELQHADEETQVPPRKGDQGNDR